MSDDAATVRASDRLRALAAEGNIAIEEAMPDRRDLVLWAADAAEALLIVPLDEWEELANEDLLDLIDTDTMEAFLSDARSTLARLAVIVGEETTT